MDKTKQLYSIHQMQYSLEIILNHIAQMANIRGSKSSTGFSANEM